MIIVKLGGGASINLEGAAEDLAGLGEPFVLVHGANALRDQLGAALGWPKRILTSVSGYSSVHSDEQALDLLLMSYAGLRNQRLVEMLQRRGVNAIGLSGLDGRLVQGRRNRGIRVREGTKQMLVHDFSGKPQSVNGDLLRLLLERGYAPVLSVPIADEEGHAINAENDDVVAVLQAELHARLVLHLIEAPGLLDRPDDPATLVRELPRAELLAREEAAEGRFKRKLLAIRRMLEAGGGEVRLSDGRLPHPVREALAGAGTLIR